MTESNSSLKDLEDDIPTRRQGKFTVIKDRGLFALCSDDVNGYLQHNEIWEFGIYDEYEENVYGDVLVAGLGLGYALRCVRTNRDVTSIDCVEIEQDIIDLVWDFVKEDRYNVFCADITEYLGRVTKEYDFILLDIYGVDPSERTNSARALCNLAKQRLKRGGTLQIVRINDGVFTIP